jgi:hypothetical protein
LHHQVGEVRIEVLLQCRAGYWSGCLFVHFRPEPDHKLHALGLCVSWQHYQVIKVLF